MAQNQEKKGVLLQIIAAVAIAILAGGTSPWWWNEVFPGNIPPEPHPRPDANSTRKPVSGGPIVVSVATNPPVISKGQKTAINVFAQNSQGQSLSSATVTVSAGGGRFDQTGTTRVSGQTDSSGMYRAYWTCNSCAPAYIGGIRITKTGYEEAESQWRIDIR